MEHFQRIVGTIKTILGWGIVVLIVNLIVYIYIFEF